MKDKHEKKVCKCVIDFMGKRKKINFHSIIFPDEHERNKPSVDVFAEYDNGNILMEHTIIESYPEQREDFARIRKLLKPLETILEKELSGNYELGLDVGSTKGAKNTKEIQEALVAWIKEIAPQLKEGSPDTAPYHFKEAKPDNVPFKVALYRWPGEKGKLRLFLNCPPDLDDKRTKRIKSAFESKCPKLISAKTDDDVTVLLLELNDLSLGNYISVATSVQDVLNKRSENPDEIYFIRTELDDWWIWVLKEGNKVFRYVEESGPYIIQSRKS